VGAGAGYQLFNLTAHSQDPKTNDPQEKREECGKKKRRRTNANERARRKEAVI
jgi:hypothetical protein